MRRRGNFCVGIHLNTQKMKTSLTLSTLLVTGLTAFLFTPWTHQGKPGLIQPRSMFEWLEQPEILRITLETDLRNLLSGESNDVYQPALFSFEDAIGQQHEFLAEVKPRGKYRLRVCDFPPLKLKFSKEDMARRNLGPYNTLKLVTHCVAKESSGQDNLLREFLAYEYYQHLTPMSYRVKLAEITYLDSQKREKPFTRLAFFLEPTEELADRLEGKEVEEFGITLDQIESRSSLEMRAFQYLIGNSDWDIPTLRNIKLIRHEKTGDLFAVPFDFDLAGWVDASYAVPNINQGQFDVKDRLFHGALPSPEAWNECLLRFERTRPVIETEIQSLEGLSPSSRRELFMYLDTFFNRDGKQLAKRLSGETERA